MPRRVELSADAYKTPDPVQKLTDKK